MMVGLVVVVVVILQVETIMLDGLLETTTEIKTLLMNVWLDGGTLWGRKRDFEFPALET